MSDPRSGADVLARIKPVLAERREQVILRPDLIEAWRDAHEALEAQQAQDQQGPPGRLADKPSKKQQELAERVQALEDEIEDLALWVTFRALPKPSWQALIEDHPPRKDNMPDQMMGY